MADDDRRPMTKRRARTVWGLSAIVAGAVFSLGVAREADAKASFDSHYTLEQTYNAALRLIRVDMALKVTERDPDAAYLLFDYKSPETGARVSPGAIEMVKSGRTVKVIVQLSQMPRYHEQVMADSLAKKLSENYGDPPARPSPPPSPPEEDGGAPDAGEESTSP